MKSLLFPGNSRSSIVKFFRSFLTLQTYWQSFRLENVTITVSVLLPTRWHASVRLGEMLQPSFPKSFPSFFKTFFSKISPETSRGIPTISRHSRLEYWAFTPHCFTKAVNLVNSELRQANIRRGKKLGFQLSYRHPRRDRTMGMRFCLRSLSSESPVYVAIFQILKS